MLNESQIRILSVATDEINKLVSCTRVMDARNFINNLYQTANLIDERELKKQSTPEPVVEEDEWWADIEPCQYSNLGAPTMPDYTPLLRILGEKPSVDTIYDVINFQTKIKSAIEN